MTQADLDAGFVTNTATASGSFTFDGDAAPTPITSDSDSVTITATQSPALTLDKTITAGTPYSAVGDTISYQYLVTNTGNVTISGISVSDDTTDATPVCDVTTLAPGAVATCTAVYTITQADLDAGFVTNNASATGTPAGGDLTDPTDSATAQATQTPSLSVEKSSPTITYAAVGDTLTYSYLVTNTGNVTLSGPFTIDDDRASDEACPATATLAPGATITCSATYDVTQADLDAGAVTNTATASGSFTFYLALSPTTITSASDSVTITAIQTPSLSVEKSSPTITYAAVGDTLTYSYLVTNTGNVTLSGPFTIDDDRASDEACPATATLAPGATITCSATYDVTQADLDAGAVTNTATASGSFTFYLALSPTTITSASDSVTITAIQTPSLSVEKSSPTITYAAVGDTLTYSYLVTNTGNVTLSGPFTIDDDRASDEACPATATLAPGATITCSATYDVTQADLDAGAVTNTATASGSFTFYLALSPTTITSASDSVTIEATQSPALTLDKTTTTADYDSVGDTLSYSYTLTNTGNVTLAGPFTVSDDRATVTCPADASLAPGLSITCSATDSATQDDLDAGFVTNTAIGHAAFTLYGDTDPTAVDSNADSTMVFAIQTPSLSVEKSSPTITYAAVGDTLTYSYLVTNTGNVTLSGPFTIDDDRASDEACPATATLAPGATITCSATYDVTQADLDAGAVTNTATASGSFTFYLALSPTTITSASDSVTITAIQTPSLSVEKSSPTITYAAVGDTLTYSYLVTNTGNVTLSGPFTIDDDRASDEACPATATLAPGATITCSATYDVTQADLDAGAVTNTATASGSFTFYLALSPTTITSASDSVTITAIQTPSLSVEKSSPTITYAAVGDTLTYSYLVTNTGNVTLSGPFTIDDDRASDEACPATATLAPGATITCSATYDVTQADLDAGAVTNTATASGSFTFYLALSPTTITSASDSVTIEATQSPALTLDKTTTTADYDSVGDTLSYSYTLTNTGNVTLAGPFTVSDDRATVTCPADASLAPGLSITCSATDSATQDDLDAGFVTNTAIGHAAFTLYGDTDPTAVDSNADSTMVFAIQTPSLSVEKSSPTITYAAVGDTLTYSYLVTNTGNVTLSGPFTIDDDRASDEACPATATLAPGATITCSATYDVTQADLDAGAVTNTATASGSFTLYFDSSPSPITSDPDSVTITATQSPALGLVKTTTTASFDAIGDTISYSYELTNTGNVTLSGPFTVSDDQATVTCPVTASLAPGDSITCSASDTATQADLDAGFVTNVATAHAAFTLYGDTDPTVVDSNEDTTTVLAIQSPALTLAKTTTTASFDAIGDTISYSYELTNTGNVTLSGPFTVSDDQATVTCPVTASLAPGDSITCSASDTATQADLDAGFVTNVATAHAAFTRYGDTDPTVVDSNEDTTTVLAIQYVTIDLDKAGTLHTDGVGPVGRADAGDTITYSFDITNTGNVTLHDVVLSDLSVAESCGTFDGTLAPGETVQCTATHTLSQGDVDAGVVNNSADVRAEGPLGDDTDPLDDAPITTRSRWQSRSSRASCWTRTRRTGHTTTSAKFSATRTPCPTPET